MPKDVSELIRKAEELEYVLPKAYLNFPGDLNAEDASKSSGRSGPRHGDRTGHRDNSDRHVTFSNTTSIREFPRNWSSGSSSLRALQLDRPHVPKLMEIDTKDIQQAMAIVERTKLKPKEDGYIVIPSNYALTVRNCPTWIRRRLGLRAKPGSFLSQPNPG